MSPQFLASNYRLIATIPYLCVPAALRKERRGSFARRLSPFLLPFSPFVRLFQLSDPLARPVATQRTTRPAFDHRREPGRILSLVRSCASLSLSLSYTLRLLSYPLERTQMRAERVHMPGYTQRRAAFLLSSIRSAAGASTAFFLISLVCTEIEFPR